ncbi:hypothetical protein AB0I49_33665 [Streptomyces sp. NPDC050617]|uniref:hypothetical protein n=1 Tax=Streptomyces sp. NPDC050617 TaxID=3154628 RepID=UPI003440DECD
MQPIGFFRELEPDSPHTYKESISDSITTDQPHYPKDQVVQYLDAGHPILDIMEMTVDVIERAFQTPGGSSILTDGSFIWRADLSAYIKHYSIRLPKEFLEFMSKNHYEMPTPPHEHLVEISLSTSALLGFRDDPGVGPRPDYS